MNDVDEQLLRTALEREVDRVDVPAPPLGDLLKGGRAMARTRRLRAGIGVAAAVVGIALGGAVAAQPGLLHSPDPVGPASPTSAPSPTTHTAAAPATVADLPQGDAPALPYAEGKTIHSGGTATTTETGPVWLRVGGDVIVTHRLGKDQSQSVHLFDSKTGAESRLTESAAGSPVVSVDGRFVAWPVRSDDGTAHVELWSVADGSPVTTVAFPFRPTCCDNPFRLIGIDGQGRVYGVGGDTTWMAGAGRGAPEVVRGLRGGYVTEATPDGVVARIDSSSKDGPPTLLTGRVGTDGSFTAAANVPGLEASVSWNGSSMAYIDGDGGLRVRDLASGDEQGMRLPERVSVAGLIWEDANSLLVQAVPEEDEGDEAWVRCFADTGDCELATMLGGSSDVAQR